MWWWWWWWCVFRGSLGGPQYQPPWSRHSELASPCLSLEASGECTEMERTVRRTAFFYDGVLCKGWWNYSACIWCLYSITISMFLFFITVPSFVSFDPDCIICIFIPYWVAALMFAHYPVRCLSRSGHQCWSNRTGQDSHRCGICGGQIYSRHRAHSGVPSKSFEKKHGRTCIAVIPNELSLCTVVPIRF